ncbi:MAG: methanethiol S-methyltransferase [Thermoanaerobaculia bacterium]
MKRLVFFLYGILCYALFFAVFLYAIGFVGNLLVPKSIDNGPATPILWALLIDAALLTLFAVQHSVMARPGFKKRWTKIVPPAIERSTYVLFANLALILLYWQWRPVSNVIWSVEGAGATALTALFWTGWGIVFLSTFMISHVHLFGLQQIYQNLKGRDLTDPQFTTRGFYSFIRHPLMFGFIIAFWSAPVMTAGHLFFAAASTGYILVALQLEEHDLVRFLGRRYLEYRERVPMLLPLPKRRSTSDSTGSPAVER